MMNSHVRFLANTSKKAAESVAGRFVSEIRSLESMPFRYPFFEAEFIPPNKYHKLFVENNYLILYQVKDDTVYVDYVLDCRKDYEFLL